MEIRGLFLPNAIQFFRICPEGKVALMFLKMKTQMSFPKPMVPVAEAWKPYMKNLAPREWYKKQNPA